MQSHISYPILVLDLEATCADDGSIPPENMETIEIGACWISGDGTVLERFQSFVSPIQNPELTQFCVQLTGIHQADLKDAPFFPAAATSLQRFIELHRAPASHWLSWGAYDDRQLHRDSERHGVSFPMTLPHLNGKRLFAKAQRIGKEVGMAKACELAGLSLEGAHHRALDDALNIARLLPWIFGARFLKSE